MTRYDKRTQLLAILLSAVAGYVDATGFVATGGFFLSFMSGNTTRFAVGMADGAAYAGLAASLIGAFVAGAMAGSLIGRAAGKRRRCVILVMVAVMTGAAATLALAGAGWVAFLAAAAAMGAENAVFEADGEVHIGLTYMTGALVKVAQRLAAALSGGDRWSWLPYLCLWAGLVTGAVIGAATYPHLGMGGLWIASGALAGLAVAAWFIGPDRAPVRVRESVR